MYIRTKDGVYKIDEVKPYFLDEKQKLFINNELKVAINEQRVINQSENLEKLCDDFVGLIKDRNSDFIITKVIAHSLKELKDSLKTEFNGKTYYGKFDIIYGAIWADKGLIYVAKINENGDWELI